MRLEVLVKYAKPKEGVRFEETEEDKEDRRIQRLIGKEEIDSDFEPANKFMQIFDPKNLDFFYKPYVVDTKDIHDFCPYDEEHVLILTEWGGSLPIKMSWPIWKATWEHYTGEMIQVTNNNPELIFEKKAKK